MTTFPPEIIDHFRYFLTELLQIASCHEKWDADELHRALKWARYCKKVFSNLKLCNSTFTVDSMCDSLQPLMEPMSKTELLAVLEDPESAFSKAIMQNPFLSNEVFAEFMKIQLLSENAKDQFIQDAQKLASSRATAVHLINSLQEYNCASVQGEIEALYR